MAAISDLVRSCLTKFTALVSSATLVDHAEEVSLQSWRDEMGRLRIWSANIGAHQRGQSSLEFRLRDASHIRSQTINLLQGLEDLLKDLGEVLEEDPDEHISEDIEIPEGDDTTEVQQLHKEIVETIHHLYRMSMIIRTPAHRDRLLGTDKLDAQPFKHWAHNHASNKYPLADTRVLECVSNAMALQRATLKYRERHHAKLSQYLDEDVHEGDQKSNFLSETVVTHLCHDLPAEPNDLLSVADTSETQTSYAGTLINGTGATIIPPLPKEGANNTPFECPYCFLIISVRDTRAWTRHIFRDLMPYVCIFPDCSSKLYESRRQWYAHVRNAHADSMKAPEFECSICKDSFPSAMYERHVSRHLEELALFYLPRTETDEEDSDKETDETDGEAAGVSSDEAFQKTTNSQALFIMKQLLESNNPPSIDSLPQANSELKKDPRGTIDHLNQLLYQDVEDSDNESLDSLHSMPAGQDLPDPAPDHLFLRTRESSWKLRFAAFSISEGVLKVGEIRTEAAKILRVSRELIILIYKGQILSDDQTPCNAMGIKHQSELFCVTSEADTSSTMDFLDLPDIPNSGESHNLPETPRDKGISLANFSDNYIPASAEEQVKATAADNLDKTAKGTEKRKPIEFKDALGRKFSFPFELCATWQGMEDIIRQAFLYTRSFGSHVADGHYDLTGPNGDIILPQVWETMIEPGWTITMHMWPISEKPKEDSPPLAEVPPTLKPPADVPPELNTKAESSNKKEIAKGPDMSEILATWVLDTAKKKKYTSPASSRRSSMEGFFAPQDDADDITDLSLGPDKFYGGDKAEDKRNATTLTSNEPSNAETALLVANVDLDRLRRQYSSLRAELRNRPNEGQKRQNDCFKLIGWMTAQMTKMTEIKTQNQLDEAEVSSHIQELQGMKDQLNLLAGTQDSEKPRKTDDPRGFSHIGSWTSS